MSDAPAGLCSQAQPGKQCLPCEGGLPVVTPERLTEGLAALPLWVGSEDGAKISRAFVAKNFVEALAFFQAVGAVAEAEGVSPMNAGRWVWWIGRFTHHCHPRFTHRTIPSTHHTPSTTQICT